MYSLVGEYESEMGLEKEQSLDELLEEHGEGNLHEVIARRFYLDPDSNNMDALAIQDLMRLELDRLRYGEVRPFREVYPASYRYLKELENAFHANEEENRRIEEELKIQEEGKEKEGPMSQHDDGNSNDDESWTRRNPRQNWAKKRPGDKIRHPGDEKGEGDPEYLDVERKRHHEDTMRKRSDIEDALYGNRRDEELLRELAESEEEVMRDYPPSKIPSLEDLNRGEEYGRERTRNKKYRDGRYFGDERHGGRRPGGSRAPIRTFH